MFYAGHGNQSVCGSCKASRPAGLLWRVPFFLGQRRCDHCWRPVRRPSRSTRGSARRGAGGSGGNTPNATYRTAQSIAGARRRLVPLVAQGWVRCARGAACKRVELIDGSVGGGPIEPGERWHLGHPVARSVRRCRTRRLQHGGSLAPPRTSESHDLGSADPGRFWSAPTPRRRNAYRILLPRGEGQGSLARLAQA